MKKFLFGFAAVIALGFTACTDVEPTTDNTNSNPIVGKWEVTDISTRVQDSMTGGSLVDTTIAETYSAGEMVIDLRENGDAITSETMDNETSYDTAYYTYTAPVLKLYEDKNNMMDFEEYNVTLSGDNVALKSNPFYETVDFSGLPLTLKITATINAKKK